MTGKDKLVTMGFAEFKKRFSLYYKMPLRHRRTKGMPRPKSLNMLAESCEVDIKSLQKFRDDKGGIRLQTFINLVRSLGGNVIITFDNNPFPTSETDKNKG